jgi:aryl carrier-like protein
MLQLSHEDWQRAVEPKVDGTWNLHNALAEEHLDFFVLFSSLSSVVGNWGQANYNAANAFIEGFVQYRRSLGLPASALSIGVMEDIGYVSQNQAVLAHLRATNYYMLQEQDLLDALQLVMASSSAGHINSEQLAIGLRSTKLLADPTNRSVWKRDIRMSAYKNLETTAAVSSGGANEGLNQLLVEVAANPSTLDAPGNLDLLTREIGIQLYSFLARSIDELDVKQLLSALGVDSLVTIEIRNWWRRRLGLEISVLEILSSSSIEDLGKLAADGLRGKYHTGPMKENGDDTYLLMKAP